MTSQNALPILCLGSWGLLHPLAFILTESGFLTLAQSLPFCSYPSLSHSHREVPCSHLGHQQALCLVPGYGGRTSERKLMYSVKVKQDNQSWCWCSFDRNSRFKMQSLSEHYQGDSKISKKTLMVSQGIWRGTPPQNPELSSGGLAPCSTGFPG